MDSTILFRHRFGRDSIFENLKSKIMDVDKGTKIVVFLIAMAGSLFSCSKDNSNGPEVPNGFVCGIDSPVSKGDRMIGIDLLNLTESNTFDDNINLAAQLGMEFIGLHITWTSIESSANTFTDPGDALFLLSQVAIDNNLKFSLTIRPIDITGKTVPPDLNDLRFNENQMIERFKSLIDFVFTKVAPSVLLNLQIGNEIDGFDTTNEDPSFWTDYGIFLKEITAYIHSNYPTVIVGFTGTFNGLLAQPTRFNDLLENVDILGVTYYPLKSNFDVKEPSVVFADFDNLVAAYKNAPIYLQEVGYQTSPQNNSSEAKQAEFYCNFFKAWDEHLSRIKTANIVRMNDLSMEEAAISAGPYGISGNSFIEYLRTLGIRTFGNKGTNKQTFEVIKNNLQLRGW